MVRIGPDATPPAGGAAPSGDVTSSGHSASPLVRVPGRAFKTIAFRLNAIPADSPDIRPIWWRADGTPVTNDGPGSVVRFATREGDVDLWTARARTSSGSAPPQGGTTMLSQLFAEGVADLDATVDFR